MRSLTLILVIVLAACASAPKGVPIENAPLAVATAKDLLALSPDNHITAATINGDGTTIDIGPKGSNPTPTSRRTTGQSGFLGSLGFALTAPYVGYPSYGYYSPYQYRPAPYAYGYGLGRAPRPFVARRPIYGYGIRRYGHY
jgi:hypothetical protein